MNDNFTVECNVCGHRYDNWSGSTPCCGAIAYVLDGKGNKTTTAAFMALVSNAAFFPVKIDMNKINYQKHFESSK